MYIGVFVLIGVDHALDHLPGLLGRGGIVEIDQRLAVDLRREDREIGPDRSEVRKDAVPEQCLSWGMPDMLFASFRLSPSAKRPLRRP